MKIFVILYFVVRIVFTSKFKRPQRTQRPRPERPQKPDRPERPDRPQKGGRPERPKKVILKPIRRLKAPKSRVFQVHDLAPEQLRVWNANDLFYPKAILREMAASGVDISEFPAIVGKIDSRNRAIVSTINKWEIVDSSDGKIVVPYTFHTNFPWKTEVVNALADMNDDLGCVKLRLKS